MPSLRVRYLDSEKVLSFESPQTSIDELLTKAKSLFQLPPDLLVSFQLVQKTSKTPGATVDPSLPFRLTGIFSNSPILLVASRSQLTPVQSPPPAAAAAAAAAENVVVAPSPPPPLHHELLIRIIRNLLDHPSEWDKYGKIKQAKFEEKTKSDPESLRFLVDKLKFSLQDDSFVLLPDSITSPQLEACLLELTMPQAQNDKEEEEEEFDPFRVRVSTVNAKVDFSHNKSLDTQVEEYKERRLNLYASHAHALEDRKVCAFASSRDIPRSRNQDDDEDEGEEKDSSMLLARHAQEEMEKQKLASQFQTKAMKELQVLRNSKIYLTTLIRVMLPNRTILQALFHTMELAQSGLQEVMTRYTTTNTTPGTFMCGPTRSQRISQTDTFYSLNLFPAAFVYWVDVDASVRIQDAVFLHPIHSAVPVGVPLIPAKKQQPTAGGVASVVKPKWLKTSKKL